jgi:hypothetical protein
LAKGIVSFAALQAFARKQASYLKEDIAWAAQTQVSHWMKILADWKKMLGGNWEKTYAASNSIYATRQNNVLFSVLAQFFGPQAMNDRLVLFETLSFNHGARRPVGGSYPDHRRPFGWSALLWQLLHDGL